MSARDPRDRDEADPDDPSQLQGDPRFDRIDEAAEQFQYTDPTAEDFRDTLGGVTPREDLLQREGVGMYADQFEYVPLTPEDIAVEDGQISPTESVLGREETARQRAAERELERQRDAAERDIADTIEAETGEDVDPSQIDVAGEDVDYSGAAAEAFDTYQRTVGAEDLSEEIEGDLTAADVALGDDQVSVRDEYYQDQAIEGAAEDYGVDLDRSDILIEDDTVDYSADAQRIIGAEDLSEEIGQDVNPGDVQLGDGTVDLDPASDLGQELALDSIEEQYVDETVQDIPRGQGGGMFSPTAGSPTDLVAEEAQADLDTADLSIDDIQVDDGATTLARSAQTRVAAADLGVAPDRLEAVDGGYAVDPGPVASATDPTVNRYAGGVPGAEPEPYDTMTGPTLAERQSIRDIDAVQAAIAAEFDGQVDRQDVILGQDGPTLTEDAQLDLAAAETGVDRDRLEFEEETGDVTYTTTEVQREEDGLTAPGIFDAIGLGPVGVAEDAEGAAIEREDEAVARGERYTDRLQDFTDEQLAVAYGFIPEPAESDLSDGIAGGPGPPPGLMDEDVEYDTEVPDTSPPEGWTPPRAPDPADAQDPAFDVDRAIADLLDTGRDLAPFTPLGAIAGVGAQAAGEAIDIWEGRERPTERDDISAGPGPPPQDVEWSDFDTPAVDSPTGPETPVGPGAADPDGQPPETTPGEIYDAATGVLDDAVSGTADVAADASATTDDLIEGIDTLIPEPAESDISDGVAGGPGPQPGAGDTDIEYDTDVPDASPPAGWTSPRTPDPADAQDPVVGGGELVDRGVDVADAGVAAAADVAAGASEILNTPLGERTDRTLGDLVLGFGGVGAVRRAGARGAARSPQIADDVGRTFDDLAGRIDPQDITAAAGALGSIGAGRAYLDRQEEEEDEPTTEELLYETPEIEIPEDVVGRGAPEIPVSDDATRLIDSELDVPDSDVGFGQPDISLPEGDVIRERAEVPVPETTEQIDPTQIRADIINEGVVWEGEPTEPVVSEGTVWEGSVSRRIRERSPETDDTAFLSAAELTQRSDQERPPEQREEALADPEEIRQYEREELARQTLEQVEYETEQEFGEVDPTIDIVERSEQDLFQPPTTEQTMAEEAKSTVQRQEEALQTPMEDLTPWERQTILGQMGSELDPEGEQDEQLADQTLEDTLGPGQWAREVDLGEATTITERPPDVLVEDSPLEGWYDVGFEDLLTSPELEQFGELEYGRPDLEPLAPTIEREERVYESVYELEAPTEGEDILDRDLTEPTPTTQDITQDATTIQSQQPTTAELLGMDTPITGVQATQPGYQYPEPTQQTYPNTYSVGRAGNTTPRPRLPLPDDDPFEDEEWMFGLDQSDATFDTGIATPGEVVESWGGDFGVADRDEQFDFDFGESGGFDSGIDSWEDL